MDEEEVDDSFHVWGDDYYDLPIKIPNLDIDILDDQDTLDLNYVLDVPLSGRTWTPVQVEVLNVNLFPSHVV